MFSGLKAKTQEGAAPLFSAAQTQATRRARAWLESRINRAKVEEFAEVVELTPELAELLLERNSTNRIIKADNLATIRQDILEGRWLLNGETIVVSASGELNDGQHRCMGVKESGRSIRTFISFGVSRESRSTTDSGIAKTPGDHLSMVGIVDPNHVAAVAGFLWQIERFEELPKTAGVRTLRPSKAQLQETATKNLKIIQDAMSRISRKGSGKIASISQLAVAHILIGRVVADGEAIDAFFAALTRGSNLAGNDPILIARERMIDEKRKRGLTPHKAIEIILRAWNLHRRRASISKIQLAESWPKIAR